MRKLNIFAVLALGLTAAVLLLTNWGFKLSEQKNQFYQENQDLSEQVKALDGLKYDLQKEVDTLMNAYGVAVKENELLDKLLNKTKRKLTATKADFQEFKLESDSSIQTLKESIQQLVKAKSTLEVTLQEKTRTNDVLLEQAGIDRTTFHQIMDGATDQELAYKALEKEFTVVQKKRDELARERAARRLMVKSNQKPTIKKKLRATGFRMETEMKNGKLTAKAKKVRKVVISFNLNEVPEHLLGEQELFLVVKDAERKPLFEDAETVKINIKGLLKEVRIVKKRTLELDDSQRLNFRLEVERLHEGYHKVEVYTKNGLLGESSFRVEK